MSSLVAHKKLRPPLKWHGGKAYLARRIVSLFPPHAVYCEPFFGGGSVLLNKAPCGHEAAGDLDADLIAFWRELAIDPEPFIDDVRATGYTEERFARSLAARGPLSPLDFLVRNRFSRGGLGKTFAWSDRLRGGQPGDINAWETIKEELPAIADRVRNVVFHNRPAVELIALCDTPNTLIYCDPPYLHETRTATKAYAHEMSRDDHAALLNALRSCRGRVFLSGYRSDLYDTFLSGWTRHEFDMPNHSGQGKSKQRRVECLWTNA